MLTTGLFLGLLACPPGQVINADLAQWKKEVRKVRGNTAIKAHLDILRLEAEGTGALGIARADIFEVKLTNGETPDRVVQVHYGFDGNDEMWEDGDALSVVVLRPMGPDRWCFAGRLGVTRSSAEVPCDGGPETDLPMLLHFVPLLQADRMAIRATLVGGACAGTERGTTITTQLHAVVGDSLKMVFETNTFDSAYVSPNPPTSSTVRRIRLTGAFPKQIDLETKVVCEDGEQFDNEQGDGAKPCSASRTTERLRFDGQRYVAAPAAKKATKPAKKAIEPAKKAKAPPAEKR